MLVGLLLCFGIGLSGAQDLPALYPFGPDAGDYQLPSGAGVSTEEIILRVPIRFYNYLFQSLYVNGNGLISFLTDVPKFFNIQFPLEYPVIAALYTNADTTASGHVFYRETQDQELLARISDRINSLYPNLEEPFQASSVFVTTWHRVGYYPAKSDKANTFQVIVATDGDESFAELLYPRDGIKWIQAVTGGSGLPDARAQAGLIASDGRLYTLKGSGTDQIINLFRWTNTGVPGSYMFRIGKLGEKENVELPQVADQDLTGPEEEPTTCTLGQTYCHSKADCFNTVDSFCCRCQPGFYGNGRHCFMDRPGSSVRVNGKINITINGESVKDVSLQAYVVIQDGRSYTAVIRLPETMGFAVQFLESLGSVIAWLFARPINNAKNGYQLTGGEFNHTVDITLDSGERVHIKQRYLGLDVYDQLRMEAEITGSLPYVRPGMTVDMPDFQEWFTRTGQGSYRSQGKLVMNLNYNSDKPDATTSVHFSKDQTIEFIDHCPESNRDLTHLRLSSARNYIIYNSKDEILRFASTNKISKGAVSDDPCLEGQMQCVANSTCIVQDETFKCVCNPGFESIYDQNTGNDMGCGDVNECNIGTAACDHNAICLNEIGSYNCQCKPGFVGDGRRCTEDRARTCEEDPSLCYIENGYCRVPDDPEQCYCNEGYEKQEYPYSAGGFLCEDIDECSRGVCHAEADCYNSDGGFRCICKQGFEGDGRTCSPATRPESNCDRHPCPTNSYCVEEGYDRRPKCICEPGFKGVPPYCTSHTYGCSSDGECSPDARCMYNETVGAYACHCLPGYSGDGHTCTPPSTQETLPKTCLDEECWCPPGYSDMNDVCVKTETTPAGNHTSAKCQSCDVNAKCLFDLTINEYHCKCISGYEGDGYTCAPTESEVSCQTAEICDQNAICQYDEINGKHICICDIGFAGDGQNCYPSGECNSPSDCGEHEVCQFNDITDYNECTCDKGYRRNGEACIPDCLEECHLEAECQVNDRGVAECICREGMEGDGVYECKEPGCALECHPQAHCIFEPQTGYTCKCPPGYDGDGYTCEETCYVRQSMCSEYASCEQIHGSFHCRCLSGFVGNGTYCKEARQQEEFLLINQGRATLKIPFKPTRYNRGKPIHVYQGQTAIGIAIDCVEGRVYWSDIAHRTIRSSKFDGSDLQDFLTTGISSVEGLAIDWINRYIYWTDSGLDAVSRAHLETKEATIIASTELVNPRGIAVHPWRRKLFWTDWNRDGPKIEMADLNGENRVVLMSGPNVQLPNSLAIDWQLDELCWADAGTFSIGCMSMSNQAVRAVARECSYPFGLAITPDQYYWTDWRMHKIETATKLGGKLPPIDLPLGGDDKLYGIAAVMSTCPL